MASAAKNTPRSTPDALDDLSDLLGFDDVAAETTPPVLVTTPDEPAAAIVEQAPAPQVAVLETDAQREIRLLRAELLKPDPEPAAPQHVPSAQLSPEEREIRDLKDQLAKKQARIIENAAETYETVESGETLLIHFVEDGFTAQGRIWFKGQELEFIINGEAHNQTKDRFGKSWLDQTENEQLNTRGKVYFRRGPWPGSSYDNSEAAAAERTRRRAAPLTS